MEGKPESERLEISFTGKTSKTSGGLYVRVPKNVVEAYDLGKGMYCKVRIEVLKNAAT